jgi:hypothetical protein
MPPSVHKTVLEANNNQLLAQQAIIRRRLADLTSTSST